MATTRFPRCPNHGGDRPYDGAQMGVQSTMVWLSCFVCGHVGSFEQVTKEDALNLIRQLPDSYMRTRGAVE